MHGGAAAEASEKFNAKARAEGWASFCDPCLSFHRLEFRLMVATWRDLGDEEHLPSRKDLTPRRLKSLLRNIVIYERVANGTVRYRVRLMGTAFADVMGDMSGRFLDEAVPAEHLPRWQAALDTALEAGAPLRFVARADTAGKPFLVGEYFEAPLLDDSGQPTMILAAGNFAPRHWADVMERETGGLAVAAA
jgi:hypothetical protein